ncbi:MAG: hypothetical protein R3A80_01865 [Bdellovibrionota bacterium]
MISIRAIRHFFIIISYLSFAFLIQAEDPKAINFWDSHQNAKNAKPQNIALDDQVTEYEEDGLYLLNSPIPVTLPLTNDMPKGELPAYSRIRIFEKGTIADLCTPNLCTKNALPLVRNTTNKECKDLSTEELSENVCAPGEAFVIQVIENTSLPNCFCTSTNHILKNITRIARDEVLGGSLSTASATASGTRKAIPLFEANSTQFVAVDSRGNKAYEGYIHQATAYSFGRSSRARYDAFTRRYSKMTRGDYYFIPDYNKKYNGMIGGTMKRRLPDGSFEDLYGLEFYTSRSNIPLRAVTQNDVLADREAIPRHDPAPIPKPTPKPPAPAPKPNPTPAPKPSPNGIPQHTYDRVFNRPNDRNQNAEHRAFNDRYHEAMKSLAYEVTHAESAVLRAAVGSNFDSRFLAESTDRSSKDSDEKGLCWRYVALGMHKALGLGAPYLPSRKPVADKARDSYNVVKNINHRCPDGRVIPLFKKIEIPAVYKKIPRNTLFVKKINNKNMLQDFIDSQLQTGDTVVWENPSSGRAGHIEAYFPEVRSQGPDDAFFSDYRCDMDQGDGNADRPGGRSTNTLGYIMRYNAC